MFPYWICDNRKLLANNRWTRVRYRYNKCFRLPIFASRATNGNQKLCFFTIFCLRSSIILTFSIAAYLVWIQCMLHHKILNVRFFNIQFTLKSKSFFGGNYQNISCSILTRLGKTNKISHFLENLRSWAITKIKIKKLDGDYKYFILILRTWGFSEIYAEKFHVRLWKNERGDISFLFQKLTVHTQNKLYANN